MLRGALLAFISATCYGVGPIIIKGALASGMAVTDILLCRFVTAVILLGAYLCAVEPAALRIRPKTLAKAVFLAVCFYSLQTYFFSAALRTIPASTNSLILYAYPAVVALGARLFYGFALDRTVLGSLGLILAGGALVSLDAFYRRADPTGMAYAAGAMLVFSGYLLVLQRLMRGESPKNLTFAVFVAMAGLFLLVAGPTRLAELSAEQLLRGAMVGLFPTALALSFLYAAVSLIGSARVSIFSSFELVATVGLAALLLGEPISLSQGLGMLCILGGVLLPNLHLLAVSRRLGRVRERVSPD